MTEGAPRGAGPGGPTGTEIRARKLSRSFPVSAGRALRARGAARRRVAVRDLDLEVAPGEIVALVGENGSGKTTTLRLLAGLLEPDDGEALLGGVPAIASAARQGLGYAGEEDAFPPGIDIGRILRLHARLAGLPADAVDAAVAALDLGPWLARRPSGCSRGVRRRTTLAQAILGAPAALILDEPLTGLDPLARERAMLAVRRARDDGAAVLASLHDPAAVEELADRVVALHGGSVACSGSVRRLRERYGRERPALDAASGCGTGDWMARMLSEARTAAQGRAGEDRRPPRDEPS